MALRASLARLGLFQNCQTPSVDPSTFAAALAIVWVLVVLIPVAAMVATLAIETVRAAVGDTNNLEIRSSGKSPATLIRSRGGISIFTTTLESPMTMPKTDARKAGPLLIEVLAALRAGETLRYGFARGVPRWWLSPSAVGVDPSIAATAIMQPDVQSAGGSLFAQTLGQAWHYRGPFQQKQTPPDWVRRG